MSTYRSIKTIDLQGKRVLLRAGFDVKIEDGKVMEVERIEALVPTMKYILEHGASLIILSHQGRPKGQRNMEFTQKPLVPEIEKLIGTNVSFAESCVGSKTEAMAAALKPGEVVLCENLRFEPGEEKNDPELAKELAKLGDVYVNDAFTNCHRAHASMVALAGLLPAAMGLQLEREVTELSKATEHPARPLTLIISGAKMETKVPIIQNFLQTGDDILLGGCIANTFVAAKGYSVGRSKYEAEFVVQAKAMLGDADAPERAHIHVPTDAIVATEPVDADERLNAPVESITADQAMFDLGDTTVEQYVRVIQAAQTIVWNGPLGFYEVHRFSHATKRIAEAVAEATKRGCVTLVGGGDTIDFHVRYGYPLDAYTFVSTGGGAMLEFIAGKELPALAALRAA